MDEKEYFNRRLGRLEEKLSAIEKQLSDYVEKKIITESTLTSGVKNHSSPSR